MSAYSKKLKQGGQLFLSGFFTTDVEDLKQICEAQGLQLVGQRNENEWAMLKAIKN
jgi:ribosomal protein L11 methyltransferase